MTKGILKTTPIILLIVLLFLPIVFADYTQIGGNRTYFNTGTGFFNAQLTDDCSSSDITCSARTISSPDFTPLVADLDADGTNEIIVVDGDNIRLYQTSSLTILNAILLLDTPEALIIYDIDGDSMPEIIVYENQAIEIVEYNGTSFYTQTNFSINPLSETEAYVQCKGTNDCIAIGIDGTPAPDRVYATAFNSTGLFTAETLITADAGTYFCMEGNVAPAVSVADTDNDGSIEYIFTMGEITSFSNAKVSILWVGVNATTVIPEHETEMTIEMPSSSDCADISDYTSPLVFDIDGSPDNGLETVIGIMISADDFKMYSFNKEGGALDDYPEIANGEGTILSNVMRANVFTDTANEDFCIMGYQGTALRRLNLLCASEQTGQIVETVEFVFDQPVTFNVTKGYNAITHATQMSQVTTDGNNLDEFVNAYGVWGLDYVLINELELLWQNPKGDSAVIPVDVNKEGREDLLMLTSTNLWYIDDGFTNTGGVLSSYTINPCIDRTWKQNTSVTITATVTDADGDDVSARAMLYAGTANQQDSGWSSNFSSGTTFSFSFTANNTASNAWLEIYGRDVENPAENSSISVQFSVATSGAEFGDCITSESITPIGDETDAEVAQQDVIDTISDGVLGRDDDGNGGISEGWLPVIGFIAVILTFFFVTTTLKGEGITGDALVFLSAMACVITFVALVWLGWIPFWVLLVMLVFALVIISFKFRDKIQGGSTGGI